VAEELGEVARVLRRDAQGVQPIDPLALANEAADVVIAAVCLLGACAGKESARFVRGKMLSDEERGWMHNGATPTHTPAR
jgi:NTP pyrophosphatase (non-canonical NTP hydrolase)